MVGSLTRRIVRGVFIATIVGMLGASGAALVRDIAHRHQKPRVLGKTLVQSTAPVPSGTPHNGPIFSVPPQGPPVIESSSVEPPAPAQPVALPVATGCHNSADSSCGRFYWSPSPGTNAGSTMQIEWFPSNPQVGDDVAFTLTATDPDARVTNHAENFGDGSGSTTTFQCAALVRFGPWTPPARERGTMHQTFHHVYGKAGNFTAHFSVQSGACGNPYGNVGSIDVPLKVASAPAPEPTPSPTDSPSP